MNVEAPFFIDFSTYAKLRKCEIRQAFRPLGVLDPLKQPCFLFELSNFPFFQQPFILLSFVPCFLFLVPLYKVARGAALGPIFQKNTYLVRKRGSEVAFWLVFGQFFPFFGLQDRHQKIMIFLHRSKSFPKREIRAQCQLQVDFWSHFHGFWGPFWH